MRNRKLAHQRPLLLVLGWMVLMPGKADAYLKSCMGYVRGIGEWVGGG